MKEGSVEGQCRMEMDREVGRRQRGLKRDGGIQRRKRSLEGNIEDWRDPEMKEGYERRTGRLRRREGSEWEQRLDGSRDEKGVCRGTEGSEEECRDQKMKEGSFGGQGDLEM